MIAFHIAHPSHGAVGLVLIYVAFIVIGAALAFPTGRK
jgi:hypothetical protein